jgi:arsenite-transporting ATPase
VLPGLAEEFMVDYVRRLAAERHYARVVWDTAPLGQTLALLGMPTLLAEHLRMAPRVYSHLRGAGDGRESMMDVLRRWASLSAECMAFLRERARVVLVTIPETLALAQLDGVFDELARYGLVVDRIVVNNVIVAPDSPFLAQKSAQQQERLRTLRERVGRLPITEVPLFPQEVQGVERLRQVAAVLARQEDHGS